jgi:DNA-directed RNA polymerase, mitochondrial
LIDIITQDSDLIPMISKPEDWIVYRGKKEDKFYIKKYGGFISNKHNKKHFLKNSHKNIGPSKLHTLDIINSINYLSSIKYCINIDLLKIVLELLDKGYEGITKIVKINLHPQTADMFNLSQDKDKQKEFYGVLKHNSQHYGDRVVLQIALLLSKWCDNVNNSIYFPLFVDWRGRILTNTGFFSYQQGELARSLILFKDGVKLNSSGLESLKIYTANCFGKDKLAYNKRITWVDENIDNIIKLNMDFIFQADEPLLFLSCCLELKGYYDNPNDFVSRLPIYKDATCNGLQHLSVMISDINLAKFVNILKSGKDDIPQDVYGFMVTKVKIKIAEFIEKKPWVF